MHGLPYAEKQQYFEQAQQRIEDLRASSTPNPPQISPPEFLAALAKMDTANEDDLDDFLDRTQAQSSEHLGGI